MGISPRTVAFLRERGHDAVHLHEQGLDRLLDPDILDKARREGRVLLAHDLDFGSLLAIRREGLPSVIVFRLRDMRSSSVNRHLAEVIRRFESELRAGVMVSVREGHYRVRRLPIA